MPKNHFSPFATQDRLMRLPEVILLTGRCRSSIYEDMKCGRFPKPIKIGLRSVAWRLNDINSWISKLLDAC